MPRIGPLLIVIATSLIATACSAMATSSVVFIPIDAAIWTADLPTSRTAVDISVSAIHNDQQSSLQYTKRNSKEIRFYPSPLQVLEPVLEAYGGNLIDAFGSDSQAAPMSITDFKVLLNPDYNNGQFAVMLQFHFTVAGESRLITAIGSSPVNGRLDTVEIQKAMHNALATAIGQSRLHMSIVLDRTS